MYLSRCTNLIHYLSENQNVFKIIIITILITMKLPQETLINTEHFWKSPVPTYLYTFTSESLTSLKDEFHIQKCSVFRGFSILKMTYFFRYIIQML